MPNTIILLGGSDAAQQIITTPGDYTVAIAALTADPMITFSGPSVFNLDGIDALTTGYTLEAIDGATLIINNLAAVATTANLIVSGASTILLNTGISALSSIAATFTDVGGTLAFAPGLLSTLDTLPSVTGFGAGNHLDFGGAFVAGEQAVYSAATGILSLESATGVVLGALQLVGTFLPSAFSVVANAAGDVEVDFACFLRATMIQTPAGEVAVECLRPGDLVTTGSGQAVPVKAVHLRSLEGSMRTQPICIRHGAIGPGVPVRDLYVSPDHAMFPGRRSGPAGLLQNGTSIVQARVAGAIDYFHVEVEPHAILIADGAPTESYLDIGNRNHFSRSNTVTLFPSADPKGWEDACAPLVLTGPVFDAIRARLRIQAQDRLDEETGQFSQVA